jgi:hypothetical protein
MRIKLILLLLVCFLLTGLTMPMIACPPPDCGSCCYWEGPVPGGSCQLIPGTDCGDCSGCSYCYSCVICWCQCTSECCSASDCTGECHNGCSNCSCLDDQSKCTGECHTCSDGSCEDDNTKCGSDECCDDGTCVPKCTNTGQCDYGVLPSGPYPNCEVLKDDSTGKCQEAEGFLCNHNINIAINDAECADCAPSCAKTRRGPCAEIIPYRCTTHCYLLFCDCTCDEKYEEHTFRGDHYECD